MTNPIPSDDDRIRALKEELLLKKMEHEKANMSLIECAVDEVLLETQMGVDYKKYKEWESKYGQT